eukprot:2878497-Pyramimonas_sp.AAC.1
MGPSRLGRRLLREGPMAAAARSSSAGATRRPPSARATETNRTAIPEIRRSSKSWSRRFLTVFGLRGPSPGLGSVKERLRTKNQSQGSGPDLRGPRIETLEQPDV